MEKSWNENNAISFCTKKKQDFAPVEEKLRNLQDVLSCSWQKLHLGKKNLRSAGCTASGYLDRLEVAGVVLTKKRKCDQIRKLGTAEVILTKGRKMRSAQGDGNGRSYT